MSYFFQLVVSGIVVGSIYALSALGFVLIYKSSRVLNIAHGQIIAAGAFITYALTVFVGIHIVISFVLSMIITFFLAMSVERVFLRRLIGEPIISVIMVTIGLMSIIDGIIYLTPFGAGNFSFPEFFVAYILIAMFSVQIILFPSISNINDDMSLFSKLYAIALPCLTLAMVVTAHMMRQTRAAIINILSSPFIEMARLKGLRQWRVIVMHAFPNALSPVINVVALNLAYLVVGVVIVEVVFAYPGLGQLLVDSVAKRDIPVVQASGLIFATTYIGLNLLADVLSILSNPRLRNPR